MSDSLKTPSITRTKPGVPEHDEGRPDLGPQEAPRTDEPLAPVEVEAGEGIDGVEHAERRPPAVVSPVVVVIVDDLGDAVVERVEVDEALGLVVGPVVELLAKKRGARRRGGDVDVQRPWSSQRCRRPRAVDRLDGAQRVAAGVVASRGGHEGEPRQRHRDGDGRDRREAADDADQCQRHDPAVRLLLRRRRCRPDAAQPVGADGGGEREHRQRREDEPQLLVRHHRKQRDRNDRRRDP
mmetsp:Transcript_21363/g.84971  ORF Transcript_21363/g.84971 Transcript_21363/m.84971 type:complete len:239 (+) Transcript_21363:26-742(+)